MHELLINIVKFLVITVISTLYSNQASAQWETFKNPDPFSDAASQLTSSAKKSGVTLVLLGHCEPNSYFGDSLSFNAKAAPDYSVMTRFASKLAENGWGEWVNTVSLKIKIGESIYSRTAMQAQQMETIEFTVPKHWLPKDVRNSELHIQVGFSDEVRAFSYNLDGLFSDFVGSCFEDHDPKPENSPRIEERTTSKTVSDSDDLTPTDKADAPSTKARVELPTRASKSGRVYKEGFGFVKRDDPIEKLLGILKTDKQNSSLNTGEIDEPVVGDFSQPSSINNVVTTTKGSVQQEKNVVSRKNLSGNKDQIFVRVRMVESWDVLNVRMEPTVNSTIVGELSHDTVGMIIETCSDGLSPISWLINITRGDRPKKIWCKVKTTNRHLVQGWVNSWYLEPYTP